MECQSFSTAGKRMKFATKLIWHYPTHLFSHTTAVSQQYRAIFRTHER